MVEKVTAMRRLHDPPGVHHVHEVAQTGHHAEVVGDHHHRGAQVVDHLPEQLEHLGLDGHVQCGGRLVADQQGRLAGQGNGDQRPLPHTAGELVRVLAQPAPGIGDAAATE